MSTYNEMFKATLKDADLSERASHLYISHLSRLKATIQHKIPETQLNNQFNTCNGKSA
jgi:hypothetical protein